MFCGNCGKELPPQAKFCYACGHKVGGRDAAPQHAYAPEPEPTPAYAPEPEPAPAYAPEPEPAPAYAPPVSENPVPEPEPAFEEPVPEPLLFGEPDFEGQEPEPSEIRPRRKQGREEDQPHLIPAVEDQNEPLFQPEPEPELPKEYRPLSPWAYFGYGLLFLIPVVGLILLIVFSFAGGNVNRRNFARSYWCSLILVLAIVLILAVLVMLGVLKGPIEAAIAWLRETGLGWLSNVVS